MNCTQLIQKCAKRVLALSDEKLKSPHFHTCNEIERLCIENIEKLNLAYETSDECVRILRNYQIIFIDYLNSKGSGKLSPNTSAFVHIYCRQLHSGEDIAKSLASPDFLAIRKEWLNFLITGKLGEQDV